MSDLADVEATAPQSARLGAATRLFGISLAILGLTAMGLVAWVHPSILSQPLDLSVPLLSLFFGILIFWVGRSGEFGPQVRHFTAGETGVTLVYANGTAVQMNWDAQNFDLWLQERMMLPASGVYSGQRYCSVGQPRRTVIRVEPHVLDVLLNSARARGLSIIAKSMEARSRVWVYRTYRIRANPGARPYPPV